MSSDIRASAAVSAILCLGGAALWGAWLGSAAEQGFLFLIGLPYAVALLGTAMWPREHELAQDARFLLLFLSGGLLGAHLLGGLATWLLGSSIVLLHAAGTVSCCLVMLAVWRESAPRLPQPGTVSAAGSAVVFAAGFLLMYAGLAAAPAQKQQIARPELPVPRGVFELGSAGSMILWFGAGSLLGARVSTLRFRIAPRLIVVVVLVTAAVVALLTATTVAQQASTLLEHPRSPPRWPVAFWPRYVGALVASFLAGFVAGSGTAKSP